MKKPGLTLGKKMNLSLGAAAIQEDEEDKKSVEFTNNDEYKDPPVKANKLEKISE